MSTKPNICAVPLVPDTSPLVAEVTANRELHLQSLKDNLAKAQNRMKLLADKKAQRFPVCSGGLSSIEIATLYTVLYVKQALPQTGLQVLWPMQGVGEDWLGGLQDLTAGAQITLFFIFHNSNPLLQIILLFMAPF